MEPLDFLAAVLPSTGRYCTFALNGKRNIFSTTLEELFDTTKQISDAGEEVWYGLATFDESGGRKAENAQWMRSFFMDLDCGTDVKTGDQRAFPTKKFAVQELNRFLEESGLIKLGKPWLVDSGGGVHPYWPLREQVSIEQWKPVAEALKRSAAKFDFPIDTTVTADAARVLRLPGTHNNKKEPRPVVVKQVGDIFDFDEIKEALAPYAVKEAKPATTALAIAGDAPKGPLSAVASALVNNSVTKFRTIMLKTQNGAGCGQLAHYIEHASDDGMEPLWRGMLSWTKACVDGDKAARVLSAMHPYDEDRMHTKLREIKGPYACASMNTIQHGICEGCMHWGKITNPLILGREFEVAEEDVVITPDQPDVPQYYRPPAPRGFDYARNGGIIYHKPAGPNKSDIPKDILLTTYDLFMTRTFKDTTDQSRFAEFMVIKGTTQITFAIPFAAMGSEAKIIDQLASNGVLTAFGFGTNKYLAAYVHACVTEASNTEDTVNIPPHFGWQENNSFAIGDMVFSPLGERHDYAYRSTRLHNLIQATRTNGTLEDWRAVMELLRRRKMWGHLAIAIQGFSSILMHFMPKNSRACTIHVCGKKSGTGKTLALSLCSSVWGDHERYKVSAETSVTTMMQRAALWGSLPVNVDESTERQRESKGEFIPKIAFAYSNCAHKIKGSAVGNAEITHDMMWSGKMLMTSNDPALEAMLGARKHTSHGEVRRILEWHMVDDDKLEWTDEEREILSKIGGNYGVAGRQFAIWCTRNRELVEDTVAKMYEYWRKWSNATDDERFWTSSIGADLAALILLNSKHSGIIDIPVSGVRDFWKGIVDEQRQMIDQNASTALDLLNRYIADNSGSFVHVRQGLVTQALVDFGRSSPTSPKGAVRGRVEHDAVKAESVFYVEEKLLRIHCADAGVGYNAFIKELKAQTAVAITRRDLLSGTPGPAMRVSCVRVTQTLDKPDETAV